MEKKKKPKKKKIESSSDNIFSDDDKSIESIPQIYFDEFVRHEEFD